MKPSEMTPKEALNRIANKITYEEKDVNYVETLYTDFPEEFEVLKQSLAELEELKKRDTKILELLVELLNKQMLGQEGLVLINRIKNLLSWSDKDE